MTMTATDCPSCASPVRSERGIVPAPDSGDELRVRIHAHLRLHPGLTAYEIARVLQLPNPRHGGQATVRRQLIRMEDDGEAARTVGPKDEGDHRPTARWTAT